MNGNDYLFDSIDNFFDCEMWRGCSVSKNPPKLRKWFGWIYVAAFNGMTPGRNQIEDHCQDLRFKIGYTYDLNQRGKALKRESIGEKKEEDVSIEDVGGGEEQEEKVPETKTKPIKMSKKIVYVFSLPRPYLYETRMKQFLYNFINKDLLKGVEGASEIVQGLAFQPLVHILQLCILETTLIQGYIDPRKSDDLIKKYMDTVMRIPPDTVKWDEHTYYGRKYGYAQQTTIHIGKSVLETMKKTIDSTKANNKMKMLPPHKFDLLKDVASLEGKSKPKFVQWVFNTGGNDGRMNHENNPSDNISDMAYSIDYGAPDNAFSVGDLAFVLYRREKDANYFPCEIMGYLNGQYAVRWIDSRRQIKETGKWIVFDKNTATEFSENKLGDFLKESLVDQKLNDEEEPSEELTKRIKNRQQTIKELGDSVTLYPLMDQLKIRRKISRNKYRDYIQQIDGEAMAADLQPTAKLVPEEHRTVDIEYKISSQLRSWTAIYKGRRAPSEHWKTSNLYSVNEPINVSLDDQNSGSDSGSGSDDDVYNTVKWVDDDDVVEEEKEENGKIRTSSRNKRRDIDDDVGRFVSFYDDNKEKWIGRITEVDQINTRYIVEYYGTKDKKTNKIQLLYSLAFRKFDAIQNPAKFIKKVIDFDSEQQQDSVPLTPVALKATVNPEADVNREAVVDPVVDPHLLARGDGIEFLKEFKAGGKSFAKGSLGIFLIKQVDGKYRVKMDKDKVKDTDKQYRVIGQADMVVTRAKIFNCTVMLQKGNNIVDCNQKKVKDN